MGKWELRRALRYGSESLGHVDDLKAAKIQAVSEIVANGNVGRIQLIDRDKRILYFDVHEDTT